MVSTTTAALVSAVKRPRHAIIDCDIHNTVSADSLDRFLPERWLRHKRTFGGRQHTGAVYPKQSPGGGARRDSWPPSGMLPGADLDFMRVQHLDPMNVEFGILNCLSGAGTQLNAEYSAVLSTATNEWQIAEWFEKDQRLRGGIIVPAEDGELAAAEIDRMAGHPGFVQVLLVARTAEPLGRRKYWPIYRAAERHGLPVGIHFGGGGRGVPVSAAGWPSYYLEDHVSMSQAFQAHVVSLVIEGVFERFPKLRIALIEGGFAWLPPLAWRLDAHVARLADEVPHLTRKPSDYIRDHLWVTTQPIEEPHRPRDLHTVFEQLGGVDKVMFSTDYPHWDFDSPTGAFQVPLDPEQRRKIFTENARAFYELPGS
ncbi:amidohydrolase family protein [Microlunatus speluncae]|uniref:amidohydrolase family protein n=1 Tax=Microlunatus speluncae TaxID=2594267 RepID=UPI0014785203|nr:amidohydrolase family protein [Microlunatus speluncae]